MGSTTLRLPDNKLKLLRVMASIENKPISKIIESLLDDYFIRNAHEIEELEDFFCSKFCPEVIVKTGPHIRVDFV